MKIEPSLNKSSGFGGSGALVSPAVSVASTELREREDREYC